MILAVHSSFAIVNYCNYVNFIMMLQQIQHIYRSRNVKSVLKLLFPLNPIEERHHQQPVLLELQNWVGLLSLCQFSGGYSSK